MLARQPMSKSEDRGDFLLGLCSLLDVIVGWPLEQAIADLPLDARIRAALGGSPNEARAVLDAVIAYEEGRWDEADAGLRTVDVSVAMQEIYGESLRWARELSQVV